MAGDLAPGTLVAGYRIDSPIARGGMGIVYRATQVTLGRTVALKVIAPELAHDDTFRRRFARESRIAASIDHPNVIPVHEAGEQDGLLFISMRFVSGTDLGRLVREHGALEPVRAAALAGQVGSALDAAHALGLVHRDVKPANVLIAEDAGPGHAYLTDFGLTKLALGDEGLTATGQFVGTLDYVAPEQLAGGQVDARADLYSLGCMLHLCLTGQVPFPHETPVAKMYAHANESPPSLRSVRAELPERLEQVLARALAKDPAERFQSAGDLGRAAVAAAAGAPVPEERGSVATGEAATGTTAVLAPGAVPDGIADAVTPATGVAEPPTARGAIALKALEAAGARPRASHRRGLVIIAAVTAITILAAAGVSLALRSTSPDQPHEALEGAVRASTITITDGPSDVAVSEDGAWVTQSAADKLVRVNPRTRKVDDEAVTVGEDPESVAVGEGYVWVVGDADGVLSRVDPDERQVSGQPIELGAGPGDVAVGEGWVWVASRFDDAILQIDPEKNEVERRIPVQNGVRGDIAVGEGAVWVANDDDDTITRIDPDTGQISGPAIRAGDRYSSSVVAGAGALWVQDPKAQTLSRIDPETGRLVSRIRSGAAESLAVGGGALWLLNQSDGTLQRVDPKHGRLVEPATPVQASSDSSLTIGENAAWVSSPDGNVVTHVGF